ncbi:MAG: hypothetical protein GF400_02695 [Candidatus Eisenbacteria bacterium]|nr:hypothetical protein [Candidatus Eisenbacteria bacterium]
MRLAIWVVVLFVAAAAVTWGIKVRVDGGVDERLETLSGIPEPRDRIPAAVDFVRDHPDLAPGQFALLAETIVTAAYQIGDANAVVAVCDSLMRLDLPRELSLRLLGEKHSGMVFRVFYAEEGHEPLLRRSYELAREIAALDDVPPEVLLDVGSMQVYATRYSPPGSADFMDHWAPYRMAVRGFTCLEGPIDQHDSMSLNATLGYALSNVAEKRGPDRAIAVADSLLAMGPCPSLRTVMLANKYSIAAGQDDQAAIEAAEALLEVGGRPGVWPLLRSVSMNLVSRDADAALALELAETCLDFAQTRRDSESCYFAVGMAHRSLENHEEAARALEITVNLDREIPRPDDHRVDALLTTYEEWGRNDLAIDYMTVLMARTVQTDDTLHDRLAAALEAEGRAADEIDELVAAHRYDGVEDAPDFTLVDASGGEFSLSDRGGRVVMLCFWGYG